MRAPAPGLLLVPQRDDLGLQPIEVQAFPFLVSKADEVFARYKDRYPHQVNYISRRHAHIFLKGGELYVEDLGSTNGTFVGGKRLDESALPLVEGDLVAFGGDHFVYRVSLQKPPEVEPTVTQLFLNPAVDEAVDTDKTTFVGAAHSFLDIFCVDPALQREDEVNEAAQSASAQAKRDTPTGTAKAGATWHERRRRRNGANGAAQRAPPQKGKPRRWRLLAGELGKAFADRRPHERAAHRGVGRRGRRRAGGDCGGALPARLVGARVEEPAGERRLHQRGHGGKRAIWRVIPPTRKSARSRAKRC